MSPNLNEVLDAALKLPAYQQKELVSRLEQYRALESRKGGGDVRKFFGTFDSGDPDSANNEKIDADLAEEYLDDHAPKN